MQNPVKICYQLWNVTSCTDTYDLNLYILQKLVSQNQEKRRNVFQPFSHRNYPYIQFQFFAMYYIWSIWFHEAIHRQPVYLNLLKRQFLNYCDQCVWLGSYEPKHYFQGKFYKWDDRKVYSFSCNKIIIIIILIG